MPSDKGKPFDVAAAADAEFENPCQICFANEDDGTVDGKEFMFCFACGQMHCADCRADSAKGIAAGRSMTCPFCRASFIMESHRLIKNARKLLTERPPGRPGRHTPIVLYNLGLFHAKGDFVQKDRTKAVEYYRRAAELGYAKAQCNLGAAYSCANYRWRHDQTRSCCSAS